jgi:hypothetical protein
VRDHHAAFPKYFGAVRRCGSLVIRHPGKLVLSQRLQLLYHGHSEIAEHAPDLPLI